MQVLALAEEYYAYPAPTGFHRAACPALNPASESSRDAEGCNLRRMPMQPDKVRRLGIEPSKPKPGFYRPRCVPAPDTCAESGGVEPPGLHLNRLAGGLGDRPHAIQEEGRGIEPLGNPTTAF